MIFLLQNSEETGRVKVPVLFPFIEVKIRLNTIFAWCDYCVDGLSE